MIYRVPGKIILFGEYAVLEGHLALVTAVDRFVEAKWSPADGLRVEAPSIGVHDPAYQQYDLPFIKAAADEVSDVSGTFLVDSSAFHSGQGKLGLGSSAAATVAFLRAASASAGHPLAAAELFRRAQDAHRRVQGTGSGADIAASTFGGTLTYRWCTDDGPATGEDVVRTADGYAMIRPVEGAIEWISAVWSGRSASTPELVRQVQALRSDNPAAYSTAITELADAALGAVKPWTDGDRERLIDCARASTDALKRLGSWAGVDLVTSEHDALNRIVGERGFVKPTGAGGGDLAWLIGRGADAEADLREELTAAGYDCYRFRICPSDAV